MNERDELAKGKLTNEEIGMLAVYNAERARGLMHNALWNLKMYFLQKRFDEYHQA